LDKEKNERTLLYAYFIDNNAKMTLTLVVLTEFTEPHEEKIISHSQVSVTNFEIIPNLNYVATDYHKIISPTYSNTI